jgi:hypothetical protein
MYSVKPFCENVQVEATSTTMYSCKSYYHDQEVIIILFYIFN